MEFFLIFLFCAAFFLCAVYGFFSLVARIFRLGESGDSPNKKSRGADWEIARELNLAGSQLAQLRLRGDLDDKSYNQLLDQLDRVYQQMDLQPPARWISASGSEIPSAAAESRPEKDLMSDVPESRTVPVVPPEEPVFSEINRPVVERTPSPFDDEDQGSVARKDPRRSLAEILSSFMLEKNIRWGELVGGLLIVGCAVGLVISLQTQLKAAQEQVPFLVPLLFMLVTAGIHGAGIYTLRKWNLHTTSQGILTIGLLLVPLNFLTATLLAEFHETELGLSIAALVVGTIGFGLMVHFSCRALFEKTGWIPALVILVGSVSLVLINRSLSDDSDYADGLAQVLIGVPLVGFLVGNGCLARHFARQENDLVLGTQRLLLMLGLNAFTLATAVGLWLSKFTTWSQPLDQLALPGSLVAATLLAVGLILQQRVAKIDGDVTLRLTGTALAVLGGSFSTLALVLAWPQPELLVLVALVNTLVLTIGSFRAALPPHQIGAAVNLGIFTTVLTHWVSGKFDEQGVRMDLDWMFSASTSLALTMAVLLIAVCGASVGRLTARRVTYQQQTLFACGGVLSVLSVLVALVASWLGTSSVDAHLASGILFAYSLGGLLAGVVSANRMLLRGASGLFWLALAQVAFFNRPLLETFLTWKDSLGNALLVSLLLHGACCSLVALVIWVVGRRRLDAGQDMTWQGIVAEELSWASLVSVALAIPLAVGQHYTSYGRLAGELLVAAVVWLVGTLVHRTRYEFAVFQGLLFGVAAFLMASQTKCLPNEEVWQQAKFWEFQFLILGISCLGWNLLRLWWPFDSNLQKLLRGRQLSLDLWVLSGVVLVLLITAGGSALPGMVNEFAPTDSQARVQLPLLGSFTTWGNCDSWLSDLATRLWIPLGVLTLATLAWLATGHHLRAIQQLLLIGLSAAILVVVPWGSDSATASALRWSVSFYGLLVALVLWQRHPLESIWLRWRRAIKPVAIQDDLPSLPGSFTWTALALTILPLLILLTIAAARGIQKLPFGGPVADTLFHKDTMLVELNYGVPLALMVSTLLTHAIARRESYYAFCGSLITMYLVGTGFLLFSLSNDPALLVRLIQIIQIAAIFAAVYGMFWLALHKKIAAGTERLPVEDSKLFFHVMIPGVMVLFLAAAGLFFTTVSPNPVISAEATSTKITQTIGGKLGWFSLATVVGLYGWYFFHRLADYIVQLSAAGTLVILGTLVAFLHGGSFTPWLAFRVMMLGMVVNSAIIAMLPWAVERRSDVVPTLGNSRGNSGALSAALGGWAFLLACTGLSSQPGWSMAALAGLLLLTSLLVFRFGPGLAYLGQFWIFAGMVFVLRSGGLATSSADVLRCGVIATILYAACWLVLEAYGQQRKRLLPGTRAPLFHRVAAISLLLLFVLAFGIEFFYQLFKGTTENWDGSLLENPTGWFMMLAGGGLLAGLLWDLESRVRLWPLFIWGLMVSGLSVMVAWDQERLWPACGLAMVTYLAICGLLWRNHHHLARVGRSLGVADAEALLLDSVGWFVKVQVILIFLITLVQLVPIWLFNDRVDRILAALVPFCGCLSLAAIASVMPDRKHLPTLSLALFTVFGVYISWADLSHGIEGPWLQRLVRLLMVTAFFSFLYGFFLPRWRGLSPRWLSALGKITQIVSVIAIVSLIKVLLLELMVPASALTATESGAVAVILLFLIIGLVAAATIPTRDPLKLSEQGRQGYIYAAQVVAALLVLHLRLAFPEIFDLALFQYWPYLLMGIAFVGCGLAEVFQQQKLTVLADPLGNTGFVLSLVPAALIWYDGHQQADPAVVLLTIGILHLVTGVIRGSLLAGLSSLLFGNLALWTFYGKFPSWSFDQHPQMWLIPPALSVLVAVQLNRRLLTPTQVSFARYASVAVIYVSSTSEVFLAGIGENLLAPMLLMVFSVAGVLIGIAMRVRIYLYLGSAFLFVSIVSMITVAHRQTGIWVWWVFGIGLGIAIISVFALFEKKRPEMLAWVEKIRNWEG